MELSQQSVYRLIKQFSGQANILTIPRLFVDLTGDHVSALFLSQVIYWSERTKDPEGWFYKTDKEWIDELGITRHQLNRITRKAPDGNRPVSPLVERLGLEVKVIKVGKIPVTHYRLDTEKFTNAIIHFLENPQSGISTNQTVENPQSGLSMESPKSGDSLHTEITREYYPETTDKPAPVRSSSSSDQNVLQDSYPRKKEERDKSPVAQAQAIYVRESGDTGQYAMKFVEELVTEFTLDWFLLAYQIARTSGQNARNLKYVRGILQKCKDEGHPPGIRPADSPRSPLPFPGQEARRRTQEERDRDAYEHRMAFGMV